MPTRFTKLQKKQRKVAGLRPTTALVKEAIFSMLGERINGSAFLDMFAGTGSMGFSALEHGAKFVQFIEKNRLAFNKLKNNLQKFKHQENLEKNTAIACTDAFAFLEKQINKITAGEDISAFDIIFADPPYRKSPEQRDFIFDLLELLLGQSESQKINGKVNGKKLLAEGGVVIFQCLGKHDDFSQLLDKFKILKHKKYGAGELYFLQMP